jgi:hypothetical protein
MVRKLVTASFEDGTLKEQIVELYGFSGALTEEDYIMAAKVNLIRDGFTREFAEKARFTVRNKD